MELSNFEDTPGWQIRSRLITLTITPHIPSQHVTLHWGSKTISFTREQALELHNALGCWLQHERGVREL